MVETKRSRFTWPFSFCSSFFLTLLRADHLDQVSLYEIVDDFVKGQILKETTGLKETGTSYSKNIKESFNRKNKQKNLKE